MTTEPKRQADGDNVVLNAPGPGRQVRFYQLLAAARKQWFVDALSEALGQSDPNIVKKQIADYVPRSAQKVLAVAGIRDEYVFPVPIIIETKPHLIGYYRLILGSPQKTFYKRSTGLGRFKAMEERGSISEKQKVLIPAFCRAMAGPLAELVRQIPNITERDLRELPLLTYGSQLQGSDNTLIGKTAMRGVFLAITEIVQGNIAKKTDVQLEVRNAAGRAVVTSLSHDPDVRIEEHIQGQVHHKVAIEVKGGTDISNAHNRAGEAEKSHQKARKLGFPEFWTIISKEGGLEVKLRGESPTTNHWFDVGEVLARKGKDWEEFRQRIAGTVGLPLEQSKTS